ncbi:MAG: ATP-binding protein [Pseudomonadales bacterium]
MKLSIPARLILSTSCVLLVFLGAAGVLLNQAFSLNLERFLREKLELHTHGLLSVADTDGVDIELPAQVPDMLFNLVDGQLVGLVTDDSERTLWRSVSAGSLNILVPSPAAGESFFGRAEDEDGHYFYVFSYSTVWPNGHGGKTTYVFTVMEGAAAYQQQIDDFHIKSIAFLTVFGLILLALQVVITHWGLRPVRSVTSDVQSMIDGRLPALSGDYPPEILPLTENLNRLVDNERRQRLRYKDQLSDLSHSLKTPLSVLRGLESDCDEQGRKLGREQVLKTLTEQVNKMTGIVDHQLQRAVSSREQTSFVATPLIAAVDEVVSALKRVYLEKGVDVSVRVDESHIFQGDENDLTEMLGNILDNAFKHCRKQVGISSYLQATKSTEVGAKNNGDAGTELIVVVEDDGPGVPYEQRADVVKRGVRLDTTLPGQGFGLAITVDIAASYEGFVVIEESGLGGAKFVLQLPTY